MVYKTGVMMIKLHSFGAAFGLIDASPFVSKVKLFLAVHNIDYQEVNDVMRLGKAPKQKFPYIDDGKDIVADSGFILEYLSKKYLIEMDSWLTDEQAATAHLISKSLEENLYWCLVYSRWVNDDTWPIIRSHFFGSMPFPLSTIIPFLARKGTIKRIEGQGMGAHTAEQVLTIAKQSFVSLSTVLADKRFFFGDKMSSLDIIAFAQLSSFTLATLNNPTNSAAREHQNLVEFTERIEQIYFSEIAR
ncbi:MAG: glutathione S-transferase family protein [Arenicella sp.]|nr:glutathione S-transferase family protein [Arenicella sp.]